MVTGALLDLWQERVSEPVGLRETTQQGEATRQRERLEATVRVLREARDAVACPSLESEV